MGDRAAAPDGPDGVLIVAKPVGMTSHDVVATIRRTLGTRRVGHGGTLDPDATGVLVVGVGRATRLLGHLSGQDKEYRAVIRLGSTTSTDDAAGERITVCDPTALAAVGEAEVRSAASRLTGTISQRPPAVSAVKVAGRRAYARARSGEVVVLEPRTVTVLRLDIHSMDRGDAHLDVTATVVCTAGTYVRSLARDMGAALGTGGHLIALQRTRSGSFGLDEAQTLDGIATDPMLLPLAVVAGRTLPVRQVDDRDALRLAHGQILTPTGTSGTVAAIDQRGTLVALLRDENRSAGPGARPVAVFVAPW